MSKPIAVISHSITHAIDTMMSMYNIREVNGAKRRLVGKDGQVYLIITEPEHLLGYAFKDTLVIPGAAQNPKFTRIYDTARHRVK